MWLSPDSITANVISISPALLAILSFQTKNETEAKKNNTRQDIETSKVKMVEKN